MNVILACCCNNNSGVCFREIPSGSGSWNVISGTWTRSGATVSSTTTTGAQIEYVPVTSPQTTLMHTISHTHSGTGTQARRLVVCWDRGVDNAYIAESVPDPYASGNWTTRIIERVGGVETVLLEEFTYGRLIALSYSPEIGAVIATTSVAGSNNYLVSYDIPTQSTFNVGIWLSSGGSGTCSFDSIKIYSGSSLDPSVDPATYTCPVFLECNGSCESTATQDEIAMDIDVTINTGGITNGSCGTCSSLEGTYTLRHIGKQYLQMYVAGDTFDHACLWRYDFPSQICSTYNRLYLALRTGDRWAVWATKRTAVDGTAQNGEINDNLIIAYGTESSPPTHKCLESRTITITGGGLHGNFGPCKIVGTTGSPPSPSATKCVVDIDIP